jgi:biopolymer transport protein ExbB
MVTMSREASEMAGFWSAARRVALGLGLVAVVVSAGGADGAAGSWFDVVARQARQLGAQAGIEAQAWARRTPPMERVTWGGLAACVVLTALTTVERSLRLRRGRIVPRAFVDRFQRRLADGQLDRGKALDYCELNPSPAARVALAAIRRWGRPAADLERGVVLARGREVDRLRRHVGTLRRVAALAPLVGLLGTLTGMSRALTTLGPAAPWGPPISSCLAPLTVGVALAIVALVLYDGLTGRVEGLAGDLDRIGAEAVDAIAATAAATATSAASDGRAMRADPGLSSARPRAPHAAPASPGPIRIPVQTRSGDV